MPEVQVTIRPDGTVEVDAVGFTGTKCLEATKFYEKALGAVVERKKKPEMEGVSGVRSDIQQGNRAIHYQGR